MALFVGCVLLPGFCGAALSWDARQIELTTKPGDKESVGVFRFVNSGSAAVTITSIQSSCGCTTAELAKRTYAPGEAGEIKAVFTIGDRVGLQEKTIHVTTDESSGKLVPLILRVTIPELLTCAPRLLLWRTAEAITEKSVIVTATDAPKITAIEVNAATPPEAAVRIEPIEPGKKYQIAIRPASIARTANMSIPFIAKFADNTTHPFIVYILVK